MSRLRYVDRVPLVQISDLALILPKPKGEGFSEGPFDACMPWWKRWKRGTGKTVPQALKKNSSHRSRPNMVVTKKMISNLNVKDDG